MGKRGPQPNIKNRRDILTLRLEGLTYKEISKIMNLSRQRIQQLISPPIWIRDFIIKKYNGKCQNCGIIINKSGHLHHIKNIEEDYNDIENLQLLCISCHRIAHSANKKFCKSCNKKLFQRNKSGYCKKCFAATHWIKIECDECHKIFKRRLSDFKMAIKKNYQHSFCDKKCIGKRAGREFGFSKYWKNIIKRSK